MKILSFRLMSATLVVALAGLSLAGTGTYIFNGNLNAQEGGAPSMTAIDPQSQNFFSTAVLYGATRTTYNTVGSQGAGNNAGLFLDASTLIGASPYSLEMVVSLSSGSGWRKLADVSGRTLDSGYYIDPGQKLDVFPVIGGSTSINANNYYYLVLTVAGNGDIKGYVDGNPEFSSNTAVMNGNVFNFFVDDAATGYNEYSNVSVGLVRLRDSVLSDQDVANLAPNPYSGIVPEPASFAALGLGLGALMIRRRRNR